MRENGVGFRSAKVDDLNALAELERQVWGEEMSADTDKWNSRLSIFPDGVQMAEIDGKVVGVVVAHMVKWDFPPGVFPTWSEITANGYLTNHRSDGNAFYGVDISVLPENAGVADKLLHYVFDLMSKRGVNRGYLGSRVPTLAGVVMKEKLTEINSEFVLKVANHDPVVKFFCRNGLNIVGAKPDYFPEDTDSLGWGIILERI